MVRTFCTNQIRNTEELSGSVWSFVPESGEHAGTSYSVVVPTVWENLPEFASYRGRGCFRRKFYGEGNVRLVCKGISHTAEIYLDGRLLGKHYNAYTPFSLLARHVEVENSENELWLQKRLKALPSNQYQVLYLRQVEKKSFEEIAQIVGITPESVSVLLSRARKQMLQEIRKRCR